MKCILVIMSFVCLISSFILYVRNNGLRAKGLKTSVISNILILLLGFIGILGISLSKLI